MKKPILKQSTQTKSFLFWSWEVKVWFVEWEFCTAGPFDNYQDAYNNYSLAMYAYDATR